MTTVSIVDQLKVLIELQGIDAQLYLLRRQVDANPVETARLKAQCQGAAQGIRVAEEQHKTLEVKRNQMEMDLGQKETQIKKLQGQLFQVKTNKEYSALQKEIEGLKADQSVLEEEILKFMEEIDRVKARLKADQEGQRDREADLSRALARIEEETQSMTRSIEELQSARQVLVPRVDPKVLTRYERILERKEGTALVPVKGEACGGCHMVLPPQVINEIQMATRLILCESCARILYLETPG